MSGALPCTGSKRPKWAPRLAEGAMPSPPVRAAASSERMSPYRFNVTMHWKRLGWEIRAAAAASTSISSASRPVPSITS